MVQIGPLRGGRTPAPMDGMGKAQIAYDHLRRSIADGSWQAGARLPTERDLARSLGLARNTVRRALDMLEAEGVIARGVGRGTFLVNGGDPHGLSLPGVFDNASPAQVMEMRVLLEPSVAEYACTRATPSDLAEFDRCLAGGENAATIAEFELWDGALHQAIVAACRNELLEGMYAVLNQIRSRPEWNRLKERSLTTDRRAGYEADHRAIVTALRTRDTAAAREAMRRHMMAVRDGMFAS